MFVDTSAVISIVCREDDHLDLLQRAHASPHLVTTALVVLESVMRLSTIFEEHPSRSYEVVLSLFGELCITIAPIEPADGKAAVEAFAQYGKGRGHPARLNLADCLSYACAKNRNIPLLYKGGDFAQTDLR